MQFNNITVIIHFDPLNHHTVAWLQSLRRYLHVQYKEYREAMIKSFQEKLGVNCDLNHSIQRLYNCSDRLQICIHGISDK
jgi:hypothetical protein